MTKKQEPKSDSKQYGLTDLEKRMIQVMQNRHQEEYANFLTYICLGRLSVAVTENTNLRIDEKGMLIVTEVTPVDPPAPAEPKAEVPVSTQ